MCDWLQYFESLIDFDKNSITYICYRQQVKFELYISLLSSLAHFIESWYMTLPVYKYHNLYELFISRVYFFKAELKFHGNLAIMIKPFRVFVQSLQTNYSMIHTCRLGQNQFLLSSWNILLTDHSNIRRYIFSKLWQHSTTNHKTINFHVYISNHYTHFHKFQTWHLYILRIIMHKVNSY